MRNIYIYLSWTGWIWFLIAGTYLVIQFSKRKSAAFRAGFPVAPIPDKTVDSTEAKKPQ
jgi:hypothetical protein